MPGGHAAVVIARLNGHVRQELVPDEHVRSGAVLLAGLGVRQRMAADPLILPSLAREQLLALHRSGADRVALIPAGPDLFSSLDSLARLL